MPEHSPEEAEKLLVLSWRLVGEFFYHWGNLEQTINRSIIELFSLGRIEGEIIVANITLRDKLHILSTIVEWQTQDSQDDNWRDVATGVYRKVATMSADRNLLAHTGFFPHDKGGVKFLKVDAKGEFNVPNAVWTEADFEERYKKIKNFDAEITRILKDIKTVKFTRELFTALLAPPSTEQRGELDRLLAQVPRSQERRRSEQPNPETSSQTNASDQESEKD